MNATSPDIFTNSSSLIIIMIGLNLILILAVCIWGILALKYIRESTISSTQQTIKSPLKNGTVKKSVIKKAIKKIEKEPTTKQENKPNKALEF